MSVPVYDLAADDLELWLAGYLREWLAAHGHAAYVSNTDPPQPRPFQVRVRYDGGAPDSLVTEESNFGVTVTGPPDDTTGEQTAAAARLVRQALIAIPLADRSNPVVKVTSVPRFVRVLGPDQSRPARYTTAQLLTLVEQPV